jgi:hypothetical protein
VSDQRFFFDEYRRKGVLVDSNLLLLLVMGAYAPHRIQAFSRTSAYTRDDFVILAEFLSPFQRIMTTPNILTEVSNLANKLSSELLPGFYAVLRAFINRLSEMSSPSMTVAGAAIFLRLGLTDAAISTISQGQFLVLTDDAVLLGHLHSIGVAVVDFNMVRALMRES